MKSYLKSKSLLAVRELGKHYLAQASIMVKETDIELLKQFRDQLWEFTHSLRSKRLMDKRLSADTRGELQELHHELCQQELVLAKRIAELQESQAIMKRLEQTALPESVEGIETRDFSTWNMWPLRYSKKLRSKLATARLPQ